MKTITTVKSWGNSLGIIIPKEIAEQEGIKDKDEVIIDLRKKVKLMELFGKIKFSKTAQEMKDEARKE